MCLRIECDLFIACRVIVILRAMKWVSITSIYFLCLPIDLDLDPDVEIIGKVTFSLGCLIGLAVEMFLFDGVKHKIAGLIEVYLGIYAVIFVLEFALGYYFRSNLAEAIEILKDGFGLGEGGVVALSTYLTGLWLSKYS